MEVVQKVLRYRRALDYMRIDFDAVCHAREGDDQVRLENDVQLVRKAALDCMRVV